MLPCLLAGNLRVLRMDVSISIARCFHRDSSKDRNTRILPCSKGRKAYCDPAYPFCVSVSFLPHILFAILLQGLSSNPGSRPFPEKKLVILGVFVEGHQAWLVSFWFPFQPPRYLHNGLLLLQHMGTAGSTDVRMFRRAVCLCSRVMR